MKNQHSKRRMAKKKNLVCTSVDDNYFWPWLVMVYSASVNIDKSPVKFILANINGMLSQWNIDIAKKFMQELELEFEVMELATTLNPKFTHQFNITVYSRLLLMDLLLENFLWLDADLLLLPGWTNIFDDVGDNRGEDVVITGVTDTKLTTARLASDGNAAFLRSEGRYVNCGVIKVSVDSWRNLSPAVSWQEIAENLEFHRLSLNDQDILNLLCAGKISLMKNSFNYIVGDELSFESKILIQHYAGDPKPWQLDHRGKEFLLGIQGANFFSPANWLTQSRNAFTYYPRYWEVENEMAAFLEKCNASLALSISEVRLLTEKRLDKITLLKFFLMKVVTRKFRIHFRQASEKSRIRKKL